MINITDDLRLGSGNGRITYRHPFDPACLLKIEHAPVKGRLRWYERPVKIAPSNEREFDGYAQMMAQFGTPPPFVTAVHGWIETNRGTALSVENAHNGLSESATLNGILKAKANLSFSHDDLVWARARYIEIANQFCDLKIYNHGLKPESVLLGRKDGELVMRLFDFKTIVYRQLVSPRYIPRGEHNVQMLTVRSVTRKFDRIIGVDGAP